MRLDRVVRSNRLWRWVLATVVLGLAALGYALTIPVRHPAAARVAALAVTRPVAGFQAHPHAGQSSATASLLSAVKAAAAATPGETAVYTVTWKGKSKSSATALVVLALPTVQDARAARTEAQKSYLNRASLTPAGYVYAGSLALASVPGAKGATFTGGTSPVTTATTRRTDAEVYALGRVVVVATSQGPGSQAKAAVDRLALSEYRHLQRTGSSPSLGTTSFPLVATLSYAGVTGAVLLVVLASPWAVAAVRRRREAAWEAAVRRERASRGSKVVKRRAGRAAAARSRPPRSAARIRGRR